MDSVWILYGICMDSVWILYGYCMDFVVVVLFLFCFALLLCWFDVCCYRFLGVGSRICFVLFVLCLG